MGKGPQERALQNPAGSWAGMVFACKGVGEGVGCTTVFEVPVAQLDRALASGAKGCGFDPRQAHHLKNPENP